MVSRDEPVEHAWMRSHARCECRRGSHHQGDRCTHDLVWEHRGRAAHRGAWEARHKRPPVLAGWEAVNQIDILCWDYYQEVARAGRPAPRVTRGRAPAPVGQGGAVLGRPALLLQKCESG